MYCSICRYSDCPGCVIPFACEGCGLEFYPVDGGHRHCEDCAAAALEDAETPVDADRELAADETFTAWLDARAAEALAHQDDAELLAGVGEWRSVGT